MCVAGVRTVAVCTSSSSSFPSSPFSSSSSSARSNPPGRRLAAGSAGGKVVCAGGVHGLEVEEHHVARHKVRRGPGPAHSRQRPATWPATRPTRRAAVRGEAAVWVAGQAMQGNQGLQELEFFKVFCVVTQLTDVVTDCTIGDRRMQVGGE